MINNGYQKTIKDLVRIGERQLEGETAAARYLLGRLAGGGVPVREQNFSTSVPRFKEAALWADGRPVRCEGNGLVSGRIKDKCHVVSSVIDQSIMRYDRNINTNPFCRSAISKGNFYFAPAVAVDHRGLAQVLCAKRVQGQLAVKKEKHRAVNILIGDRKAPRTVVFTHYDSIGPGAIDNASGVSVLMNIIDKDPDYLADKLFVIAANEEVSYDLPLFHGHGYRIFENKAAALLKGARQIVCLDSVGQTPAAIIKDPMIAVKAFPLMNARKWDKKISVIAGDIDALMPIYHSDLDDGRGIKFKHLVQAERLLRRVLDR